MRIEASGAARTPGRLGLAHWFVVPDLAGPVSGGTRYNRQLLGALARQGQPCQPLSVQQALRHLERARPGVYWVDSLHLDAMPALYRANARRNPLGLLAHYLPSLVTTTGPFGRHQLGADERFTLDHVDAFLATSAFMRKVLENLGVGTRPILVVEPGSTPPRRQATACASTSNEAFQALLVANLSPGKGVLPLLRALAAARRGRDRLQLTIVGGFEHDPDYSARCRELVASDERLGGCVRLLGPEPEAATESLMQTADLVVSASTMESYGMVLAEARTAGVPIVALAAGYTAAHVEAAAGGALVQSHEELARACLALSRDKSEAMRRARLARAHARAPRPWDQVARDFVDQAPALARL